MRVLHAKISLVPTHQLIVPSTLLAPATEIHTHEAAGQDPINPNFRKLLSKTQRIGSVQPEKFRKNGTTF